MADASWVIALRDPSDEHHARAVAQGEAAAEEPMLLHPVTLAECLVAPAKLGVLEDSAAALRAAFEIPELDDEAPIRWARLRATTALRLPDVIVLDTALVHRATTIATFDDLLVAEASAHGIAQIRVSR